MNHHLPVHRVENGPRPFYGRHPSARYYAHRVKESLTTRVSKFICTVILFILFVVGLIAFILWLSLRPHRPRFHLEEFSFPALAQPNAAPGSASFQFNVTIRNPNQKVCHRSNPNLNVSCQNKTMGDSSSAKLSFCSGSVRVNLAWIRLWFNCFANDRTSWVSFGPCLF